MGKFPMKEEEEEEEGECGRGILRNIETLVLVKGFGGGGHLGSFGKRRGYFGKFPKMKNRRTKKKIEQQASAKAEEEVARSGSSAI